MPVFEYACRRCERQFELLVRRSTAPACPACGAETLEKLVSLPSVRSSSTRGMAMRAAQRRDAKQARDRMHERIRCEKSHDRHG